MVTIRKNDRLIDTNTYILTVNAPKPSRKLKIGYMIAKVDTYNPNPLCFYNCQKFGHHESRFTRKKICKKCGGDGSDNQNPPANNLNVLTAMGVTRLTLGSVQHGKEKTKS